MSTGVLLVFLCNLDIAGYAETRPYFLWGDSTRMSGINQAWIEGKTDYRLYGGHIAVSIIAPYADDTITTGSAFQEPVVISRCAVWAGPEQARILIGKQRVSFGVGRVFRPLDVFNPVNYFEPGYERSGVNAVTGYYAIDPVTSIRAIYTPRQEWQYSTVGVAVRTTLVHHDIGISAINRPLEPFTLVGGELAGELLVGYWGEYVLVQDDQDDYTKCVVGADYSFPLRIYAMVEYFYDGSGVEERSQYDFDDIVSGRRQTLAQHYVYGSLSTIPLPFDVFRPAMNVLVNLDDEGMILIPQVNMLPFDNLDINLGVNVFLGADDSEFPNVTPFNGAAYIWARVYF